MASRLDTQIAATVNAFVAELTELIRTAALERVRVALGLRAPAKSTPSRRARPPRARPAQPSRATAAALALAPLKLPTPPAPPVVVRRFPPKQRRRRAEKPTSPAATISAAPAPAQAPVPAKTWVVVRRSARSSGGAAIHPETGPLAPGKD
jgi:hypothetical protein